MGLDLSRIVAGKLELRKLSLELNKIVGQAVDSFYAEAVAKRVQIELRFEEKALRVVGDPQRLQQVIGNLLSNAIKFTPAGGRVEIRLARSEDRVHLTVADTGQGIDPRLLPYIFEPYRQGAGDITRPYGGLGLGLTIVRYLVEQHQGNVSAESGGPDRGAKFTVTFPALDAEVDPQAA